MNLTDRVIAIVRVCRNILVWSIVITPFMIFRAAGEGTFLLDSLRHSVQQARNDTTRIVSLCRLSEAFALVESKDSLARATAREALRLAERLQGSKDAAFAAYYCALALQAMGVTYRFADEESSRSFGEPYFRAALEAAEQIPEKERSLQMQASVLQSWFLELRFRKQIHRKDDKPREELQREAEQLLERQGVIAENLNSNALRGRIVLNRAIVLTDTLSQRLLLCLQSVRLYEQSPDVAGLASALQYLGYYAEQIGDFPRTIQAFTRAARLLDSSHIFSSGLAVCYQSLGDVYLTLSDTAKALENYRRAEPYSERYDVRFNRLELLSQLGTLYRATGAPSKAQAYFERALILSNARAEIHDVLHSGRLYRLLGNYSASLTTLGIALRKMGYLSPQEVSFDILIELALTHKEQAHHYTIPQYYRASLDSALFYCKRCLPILSDERYKVGSAERFLKTYTLLYELSKELGDSRNALLYHEQREHWRDKTLNSETYRAIAAMESRAVVEAIEAKVETLEARERLQRAIMLAIGIAALGLIVIAGLLAWRFQERKRSAEILQRQNEQLQTLNHEKIEFMSIVAHDLKNPISAIRSFAEIILTETEIDSMATMMIQHVSSTADRMFELVKNLLDVNRLELGNMELRLVPVDVLPMVRAVVEQYTLQAQEKRITLHFVTEISTAVANIDEYSFLQVMDNLISNAVKYSPHGKNVFVRIKDKGKGQKVGDGAESLSLIPLPFAFIRLEVTDEGPGISPEDMKKLFGKFARLSARPTGGEHSTGLGLSIVKKMVEAMNGKVWCESEFGSSRPTGATFIVELPKA